ncbi:Cytosolic endo-beta-N-acetylglucosaminidase 2 [Galdieria sulphuraria]|nr:Cytosolic endo-beta-N-acetylglucosaminidase 2 [Galdieria sulphuraria]
MEESRRKRVARQLVHIAKTFGFEGWLFNFEVHLPSRQYVVLIGDLLKQTCDMMKDEIGQHAMVLWYDSVTVEGRLRWQNRLNEQNYYFFERCDGIFTNYHWHPNDVGLSQLSSNGRHFDVFTGIDVFGRGTFGGGGYQSYVAAQVAKQMGTSIALFAFGWTCEAQESGPHVEDNQFRFWEANTQSIGSVFPSRPLWVDLPLETFWETGYGRRSFVEGQQVASSKPYVNLRQQQLQPSYTRAHLYASSSHLCLDFLEISTDYGCGWNSGCSLFFRCKLKGAGWVVHTIAEADIWITKDLLHLRYWLKVSREQANVFTIGFVTSPEGNEGEQCTIAVPGNLSYPTLSNTFRMISCVGAQKPIATKESENIWLETNIQFHKEEWDKHLKDHSIRQVVLMILSSQLPEEEQQECLLTCHLGGIQMQQYNNQEIRSINNLIDS